MKPKQDKPPQYMLDSFYKHMEIVFKLFPNMPFGSSNRLYNSYRLAKKEYNKIKKYDDGKQ